MPTSEDWIYPLFSIQHPKQMFIEKTIGLRRDDPIADRSKNVKESMKYRDISTGDSRESFPSGRAFRSRC